MQLPGFGVVREVSVVCRGQRQRWVAYRTTGECHAGVRLKSASAAASTASASASAFSFSFAVTFSLARALAFGLAGSITFTFACSLGFAFSFSIALAVAFLRVILSQQGGRRSGECDDAGTRK